MKELNQIVVEKTQEMITSGAIEKMITERLHKTVADSIDNAMKSYSDFGKAITTKIEESIQCAGHIATIPEYNQFVVKVVQEQFTELLQANAATHLTELIKTKIEPIKKQGKFSEILQFIESIWSDTAREEGKDYIDISTSENDDCSALYVTFNHPEYESESCTVTFYSFSSDNGLWSIGYIRQDSTTITGHPIKKAEICTSDLTSKLYQYYAMGTQFERDTEFEDIDTSCY